MKWGGLGGRRRLGACPTKSYNIADQPELVFESENPAVMDDGLVAVVMTGEEVESFAGVPAVDGGFGHAGPGERAVGLGLVAAVHLKGVVGGGAAESIALGADVAEGAGIDQDWAASGDELNAQGVGMAVSAGESALWSGVDEELGLRIGHDVDSAYRERGGRGDAETRRNDDAASIVISEVWRPTGLGDCCEGVVHFLDCAIE